MKANKLTLSERLDAPTPKFFKKLRNIGLALAAVGATIVATPIALPVIVVQIGGYLTLAGSILTAVSQSTVDEEEMEVHETVRTMAKDVLQDKRGS